MKKKFVKVVLFGALTLAASASFVGCKDYDDDVKGLQEQIDAINKKEPGVTKAEMTAAIASAIGDLKAKLETAIAGKADNAAVQALQAKVTELTTALSGKADASKITELIDQITALSTEVNNVKGSLDATKTALEGEVAGLKAKIAELEGQIGSGESSGDVSSLREELAKLNTQLVESQNKLVEVTELAENNAKEISELTARITELSGLQSRIDKLEAAHADFIKTGDLAAYDGDIKKYIDEKMLNYLTSSAADSKIDAVYEYVDGAFKAGLMAELESIYAKIGAYDAQIEQLTKKFNDYAKQQGLDDLAARVKTLEDYKTATLDALVAEVRGVGGISEKVTALTTALGQITNLSLEFGKYTTSADLKANYLQKADLATEIDKYLKEQWKDNNASLADLGVQLKNLKVDVDGLKAMIQSVVFVPEFADGKVVFKTLKYQNNITVSRTNDAILKFRVSPASAAADFAKKYTVSFGAEEVASRANAEGTVFAKTEFVKADPETGMVTFKAIASERTESYAVCMTIQSKKQADGSQGFTDVNSNYFVVTNANESFTNVRYYNETGMNATTSDDIIIFDDATSKIDYENGSYYQIYSGGQWVKLVGYDLSKFKVELKLVNADANIFDLKEGVLSLKSASVGVRSNINKHVEVRADITIAGINNSDETPHVFVNTPYQQVTVTEKATNASAVYDKDLEWNAAIGAPAITLEMQKLYDAAGLSSDEFRRLFDTTSDIINAGGLILNLTPTSASVQVPVAVNLKAGTFTLTGTIKIKEAKTISVKVNVTIKTPADITPFKLNEDVNYLKDGTALYSPAISTGVISSPFSLMKDLKQLFSGYANTNSAIAAKYGKVVYTLANDTDADMVVLNSTNGTLTYNTATYTGKDIAIKAEVQFGGVAVDAHAFTLKIADVNKLNGTWVKATTAKDALTITDANKATANQLFTGFSWNDGRGKQMWKDGKTEFANTDFIIDPFAAYHLSAPVFEIVDPSGYFDPNIVDGKISLSTKGKQINGLVSDYVATVKVKTASLWGAVNGATAANTTVKVTIPKNFTY